MEDKSKESTETFEGKVEIASSLEMQALPQVAEHFARFDMDQLKAGDQQNLIPLIRKSRKYLELLLDEVIEQREGRIRNDYTGEALLMEATRGD